MESGPATSASGTGCTASGRPRVFARRAVTSARLRRSLAPLLEFGSQTRNGGSEAGGLRRRKKSRVEVESEGESEWSGLGGRRDWDWRQEVSSALVEIQGLLR